MTTGHRHLLRIGPWFAAAVAGAVAVTACTTTKRAARLVIDHHVGMAQGAMDIVTGKAEERAQRLATLQAALEANRTALAAEQNPARVLDLLKTHVQIQDALIADLLQGHHGGHQHTQAADTGAAQTTEHRHDD